MIKKCKNCKYWDKEIYSAGEFNERLCKRIDALNGVQYGDSDRHDLPGAYIWLQTETEDGLGNEIIGFNKQKKQFISIR